MRSDVENEMLRLLKLDKACKNGLDMQKSLLHVISKIRFLEGIYQTGDSCGFAFSQNFKDAAYKERQSLCITSSALHQIIREEKEREVA